VYEAQTTTIHGQTNLSDTFKDKREIKLKETVLFYFTQTMTTMFYFSFISHVRAAVFFNMLTLTQL